MRNSRLHIRWTEQDSTLATTAARHLHLSLSELVRRATVAAAIKALQDGSTPPPTPSHGHADGRSISKLSPLEAD
jgi:hypothetical protein